MMASSKICLFGLLIILVFITNLNGSKLSKRNKKYTCPEKWFDREFMLIADVSSENCFITLLEIDLELSFFKNVMGLSDAEIDQITLEAIRFFKRAYGLDFFDAEPQHNVRIISAVRMFPFFSPLEIPYNVFYNTYYFAMRPQLQCFRSFQGGFMVALNNDTTIFGTYGGESGFPVKRGTQLVYQYLYVEGTPNGPEIFQLTSRNPEVSNHIVGGLQTVFDYDVYHDTLGEGRATGVLEYEEIEEEGFCRHATARLVFTFPSAAK